MRKFFESGTIRDKIRLAVLVLSCLVFAYAAFQLIRVGIGYRTSVKEYDDIREAAKETVSPVSTEDSAPAETEGVSTEAPKETAAAEETTVPTETAEEETIAIDYEKVLAELQMLEEGETKVLGAIDFGAIDYVSHESPGKIYISGSALDVLVDARYPMDFDYLLGINPEVVGWIRVENTNIDYPMVQAGDNEKYLRLTISGEWNNAGSIFVDYRVDQPFASPNTIIHGHNQRNNMMFHELVNYADESYFNSHQRVLIYTPDGTCSTYQVFAFYKSPKRSVTYDCSYASTGEYQAYLDYIADTSWYHNGTVVTTDDRIITLSTCSNEWDDTRYVVHAKKIS